jgi:hypothetical protein
VTKQTELLDHINVTSPCSSDWDSMIGNDLVRFCAHCQLNVHNLSEISPKEVVKLVIHSRDRLCVRYRRRPLETIQTSDLPRQLYQIRQRASRIAAGAFSAALSFSSGAAAQAASPSRAVLSSGTEITAFKEMTHNESLPAPNSTIVGIILDPAGAAVPGSRVTLIDERNGTEQIATSNGDGEFQFQSLEAGTYTLKVQQTGFVAAVINNIVLDGMNEYRLTANLEVAEGLEVTVGSAVAAEPSEPLVKAAMTDDLDMVKELLSTGANVNAIDEIYPTTALAMAVTNGNLEMVQVLVWAGADVNAQNNRGATALLYLSDRSTTDVVRALIAAGAKIDLKDEDGDTALIDAATRNNRDVLQALLDAGAAVNVKNKAGETALMKAAKEGLLNNVKALILAGADVNERDEEGRTALERAREYEYSQVMNVLRISGAVEFLH